MQKVHLVVIDPQNDFVDPKGSLSVAGAKEDMDRLSSFIRRVGTKLHDVSVTLDSHHFVDTSHPIYWKDSSGNHPNPFTVITKSDVQSGKWTTTQPSFYRRALDYVTQLEKNDRYPLCIWPPHCLIGSWGASVYPPLFESLIEWEKQFAMVRYVTKGSNLFTEHYSALKADVPDPSDPSTQLNTDFIQTLEDSDYIVIAGEASSHCIKNTVYDVIDNAGKDIVSKLVILKDCMSPVPSFEKLADDMFLDLSSKGVTITTSTEFLK